MQYITSIGVIDTSQDLHHKFTNKYLDHKRHKECGVVYELFRTGNKTVATIHASIVDNIINEQMYLKLHINK